MLHRIDLKQGIRAFYSLMIEKDLFGTIRLVQHWSRIDTNGQEQAEVFASEALEALARVTRQRGYRDL